MISIAPIGVRDRRPLSGHTPAARMAHSVAGSVEYIRTPILFKRAQETKPYNCHFCSDFGTI